MNKKNNRNIRPHREWVNFRTSFSSSRMPPCRWTRSSPLSEGTPSSYLAGR